MPRPDGTRAGDRPGEQRCGGFGWRGRDKRIACIAMRLTMRRAAGLLPASVLAALLAMSGGILTADAQEHGDGASAAHGYRLAAEQGDAEAQFNLGVRYFHGRGVPEDIQEAIRWVRLAAEQGHAEARISLGALYDEGRGVPRDHEEAVRWYRLAAEQGHPEAQFNLGVSYDKGEGVARDPHEAARWYRRAAEQGNPEAQFNLDVSYDEGAGVPQDHVEAVRWYRLAAGAGRFRGAVQPWREL